MLKNPEINNGSYTTEYRQLDTRIGRWWSIDPKTSVQPDLSPYSSSNNTPIIGGDPKGDICIPCLWIAFKAGAVTAAKFGLVGAAIGGGVSAGSQYSKTGTISAGKTVRDASIGFALGASIYATSFLEPTKYYFINGVASSLAIQAEFSVGLNAHRYSEGIEMQFWGDIDAADSGFSGLMATRTMGASIFAKAAVEGLAGLAFDLNLDGSRQTIASKNGYQILGESFSMIFGAGSKKIAADGKELFGELSVEPIMMRDAARNPMHYYSMRGHYRASAEKQIKDAKNLNTAGDILIKGVEFPSEIASQSQREAESKAAKTGQNVPFF